MDSLGSGCGSPRRPEVALPDRPPESFRWQPTRVDEARLLRVLAAGPEEPRPGAAISLIVVTSGSDGGALHDLVGVVPGKAAAITGTGSSPRGGRLRIVSKRRSPAVARLARRMVEVTAGRRSAWRHHNVAGCLGVAAACTTAAWRAPVCVTSAGARQSMRHSTVRVERSPEAWGHDGHHSLVSARPSVHGVDKDPRGATVGGVSSDRRR
uniref:Uncharacterized protein n=1 Tax=Oryza nivara TaxID=4536 RepID=A0A0E0HXP0_ORYNI